MSSNWPDGWISATLKDAGLPITDFTRKVMQAWQQSTPILPYTNNPLGMPTVKGQTGELMRTGYAMFATMPIFRAAFSVFLTSNAGQACRDALALGEKYSDAWKAIHGLPWPANTTETDWPSAVLDLTSESYRSQVQSTDDPKNRTTSGVIGTQTAFGNMAGASARGSATVSTAIQQATRAVQNIPGRMR